MSLTVILNHSLTATHLTLTAAQRETATVILGAVIMGQKVGEKATCSLPDGRATTVEILDAVPYV